MAQATDSVHFGRWFWWKVYETFKGNRRRACQELDVSWQTIKNYARYASPSQAPATGLADLEIRLNMPRGAIHSAYLRESPVPPIPVDPRGRKPAGILPHRTTSTSDSCDALVRAPDTFGGWLARKRKSLGMSQGEFGAAWGISMSSISKLEVGVHQPSRGNLRKLARAFNLTDEQMQAIARGEPEPGPTDSRLSMPSDVTMRLAGLSHRTGISTEELLRTACDVLERVHRR